jgi:hypothetical protein
MKIIPAWIRKRDEKGIWALLGSQPQIDGKEEFIPLEHIENVVESEHEQHGRKFAVITLKDLSKK